MNYRELQKLCKEKGLKQNGKKADLEARLGMLLVAVKEAPKPRGRQEGSSLRSFVFIGDPRNDGHGPASVNACGYMFEKNGKPVSVSSDAASRISGNSHFTEK